MERPRGGPSRPGITPPGRAHEPQITRSRSAAVGTLRRHASASTTAPFDMLDDESILVILGYLGTPASVCSAALVCKRLSQLCADSLIWKPLLLAHLNHASDRWLSWPACSIAMPSLWRERFKQWHSLSSLSWARCIVQPSAPWPCARYLHRAAAVSAEEAYVFGGGRGSQASREMLGDLWRIRRDAAMTEGLAKWELVVPSSGLAPIARLSASISVVTLSDSSHHGLLMFGGRNGGDVDDTGTFLNDLWLFDTRTAAWEVLQPSQEAPSGRWAHSAITRNSRELVIFGGSAPGNIYNDVRSFSLDSGVWSLHEVSGAGPSPRSGHAACQVRGSMLVFGGNTRKESFSDLYAYELDLRMWALVHTQGRLPPARVGHSLLAFGNRLMLFGGRDYNLGSFDSALWCFDLRAQRWAELSVEGDAPLVRTGHAAVACDGGFLVFGGLGETGEVYHDTFVLRFFKPVSEAA